MDVPDAEEQSLQLSKCSPVEQYVYYSSGNVVIAAPSVALKSRALQLLYWGPYHFL